jgi:hypothetical protein
LSTLKTNNNNMTTEQIAKICHEANKAYCEALGDTSQKHWEEAEQWQRDSAIKGVEFRMANPNAPVSAQHDAWCADKITAGWSYGPIKDPENKQHPCLVSYSELPEEQRLKDALFQGIVDAFMLPKNTVGISIEEYDELKSAQAKLQALEGAGVDNWNGYDDAMQSLRETEEV